MSGPRGRGAAGGGWGVGGGWGAGGASAALITAPCRTIRSVVTQSAASTGKSLITAPCRTIRSFVTQSAAASHCARVVVAWSVVAKR